MSQGVRGKREQKVGPGSMSEQQQINQQEHPLLIPVVLDHLFKLMKSTITVKDMKNIRLVCTAWKDASLKTWRAVAPLRIGPPEKASQRMGNQTASLPLAHLPANVFLEMLEDPQNPLQIGTKPFANLVLYHINFVESSVDKKTIGILPPVIGTLLNYLDNNVKSVTIQNCNFKLVTKPHLYCEHIRFINTNVLIAKLGNASKISLLNNQTQGDFLPDYEQFSISSVTENQTRNPNLKSLEIDGEFSVNFTKLFWDSPNLEEFTLRKNYQGCVHLLLSVIQRRREHFPELPACPLKKLDVLESRFFPELDRMYAGFLQSDINLPLEYLSLSLLPELDPYTRSDDKDIQNILHPLLVKCQSSLKTLKVLRPPVTDPISITTNLFPGTMECLEKLHLYGNLVSSFGFLNQTPNLKTLVIDPHCVGFKNHLKWIYGRTQNLDVMELLQDFYYPYENLSCVGIPSGFRLENLTAIHVQKRIVPELINFLADRMPNLKVFKGVISNREWETICMVMPNLEEIGILRDSRVTEGALIGRDEAGKMERNQQPSYNVATMKKLKRFTYLASCGQSCVGDTFVKQGLLGLEKLEMVYLCVSKNFTAESEKVLRNRVSNVTIIRNVNRRCAGGFDCCEDSAFLEEFPWLLN